MARIKNIELPGEKHVCIGLTAIYGIGRSLSNQILKPLQGYSNVTNNVTLSNYLNNDESEESNMQVKNKSRYSFITNESGWGF